MYIFKLNLKLSDIDNFIAVMKNQIPETNIKNLF